MEKWKLCSLVPRPIPSFSMLHAEKREGLAPGVRSHVTDFIRMHEVEGFGQVKMSKVQGAAVNDLRLRNY